MTTPTVSSITREEETMFKLEMTPQDGRHLIAAAVFAGNDPLAPVLDSVRLEPIDDSTVRVVATDRYALFHAVIEGNIPEPATLPAKELSAALKVAVKEASKSGHGVTLQVTETHWTVSMTDQLSRTGPLVAGDYPPVARLFPKSVTATPLVSMSPVLLARLDKVRSALGQPLKHPEPWLFASSPSEPGKTSPVIAAQGAVTVMIQPHRMNGGTPEVIGAGLDIDATGAAGVGSGA